MSSSAGTAVRIGRFVTDALVLAALVHVMLLASWLGNGIKQLVETRTTDALVLHAVLRSGVTEEQAASTAQRLENTIRGLNLRVIGQAEARGLLSLQEPWMKSLPTVEVGRLPLLIEMHMPALRDAVAIRSARDQVSAEPEVEFVIFNENGLEDLLAFNSNTVGYAKALHGWLLILLCIAVGLYGGASARTAKLRLTHALRQTLVFASAVGMAAFALNVIAARVAVYYPLPAWPLTASWRELLLAFILWMITGTLISAIRSRVVLVPSR